MGLNLNGSNVGVVKKRTLTFKCGNDNFVGDYMVDNVVSSAFAYIGEWCDNRPIDLCSYSVSFLKIMSDAGMYVPQSIVYMFDECVSGKTISDEGKELRYDCISLPFSIDQKLEELRDVYNDVLEIFQENPLTKQDVFDHANYLLIEEFLKFRRGLEHVINFPHQLKVLNRDDISDVMRSSLLQDPHKMIFLPSSELDRYEFRVGFLK